MRECVIIPTFQRSDLLYLCLESIRASQPHIPIDVFPDRGTDERSLCNKFNAIHHYTWDHRYHGNSANMLEALKWAFHQRYDRVYVIEDDALVDQTFFPWCRAALDRVPAFAACGWQYSPNAVKGDGADLQLAWYLSVASCLPLSSLATIVPHANLDYYRDMQGYCDRTFVSSAYRGSAHHEQDGLVMRVCEAQRKRCVWPRRPRALHCGWYGYHQGDARLDGTLEERVEILRLAVRNPEILRGMMNGAALPTIGKCVTCSLPLAVERVDDPVMCAECFERRYPTRAIGVGQYYVRTIPQPEAELDSTLLLRS